MEIYKRPPTTAVEKDTQLIEDVSPQKESPPARSPSRTPVRVHNNPFATNKSPVNEIEVSPCLGSSRKTRRRIRFRTGGSDESGERSKYFSNNSTMSSSVSEAEEARESDNFTSSGESLRNGIAECVINSDEDSKENISKATNSPVRIVLGDSPTIGLSPEEKSPVKELEIEILENCGSNEKKIVEEKRLNFKNLRVNFSFGEESIKSPPRKKSNTSTSAHFNKKASPLLDETVYEVNDDEWIDAAALKTKSKVSFSLMC